jgi:methionine synthase / methylenetetrahydrofolate reductase(NADPH)
MRVKLVDALLQGQWIGDGALGTVLAARGFRHKVVDLANLKEPDWVREVHADYLLAGAEILETNTFSAGRLRLREHEVDVDAAELNFLGAKLAREAASDKAFVVGAIGPVGKPMAPVGHISEAEVAESVREQAEALANGGVDGFFLETFVDPAELKVSVEAIRAVCDLPILVSKAFIEDGEMLAEGLPGRLAAEMASWGVTAVGANCVVGPQRMLDLVRMMVENTELPVIAYPAPGLPQLVKGQVSYDSSPEYFARAAMRLFEEGARLVGGCCGTTPAHIAALREARAAKPVKVRVRGNAHKAESEKKEVPTAQPSELSLKLGRKFVTAVEMDLPRGLNLGKLLSGARALKVAGVDTINISDGARARLRMNPMSVCALLMREVGIDATMHFACRDRNLLAAQSDLLGSHALGIRNILAVTGDPANIGDYPSATSVFDIDSIGLIRILSRFNEGMDLAGYSVGVKCAFTICGAFNPDAFEPEVELDRLKRKVDAGVQLIYTQPVFNQASADRAVQICDQFGLPCLVGVLPLRNPRHAEFMHNEVPGVSVPEEIRKALSDAPDDATAAQIGEEYATNLAVHIRGIAAGLYLMPPANQYTVAERIAGAVR